MRTLHLLLAGLLLLPACKSTRQNDTRTPDHTATATDAPWATGGKQTKPEWLPEPAPYRPSATRSWDLLHTRLAVRPHWDTRTLTGTATLRLTPYRYATDSLLLDAKGMLVHSIQLLSVTGPQALTYTYADSMQLHIRLPQPYDRDDTLELQLQYTARPYHLNVKGSEYIEDARGLYFINADGANPYKPRQIWTQGETESSSCWFPTIDKPNERCTQDLSITIESKYKTLSNGTLAESKENGDGTRTDRWVMNQPHAPYLFMMAIGEFAIGTDQWRGREVSYYVEPEYAPHIPLIFGRTPEMIEFFSNVLGTPYPWPKYSQVVVRDFVSGAMENTTATLHYADVQHDAHAHLDDTQEDIIAHELFHQWFGDLVTCESWSQLPLNEAFATYGEYLWKEYKYGKNMADVKIAEDLMAYLGEADQKREPLIRHHYHDKEDMFDTHSYQKGGCTLHMLRQLLGDDAFFDALQQYLARHAYQSVEIEDLRLAMEQASGRDLKWFFDQWFLQRGHPELRVTYDYDYRQQQVLVHVAQQQDLRYQPTYRLPTQIQVDGHAGRKLYEVEITTADTTLRLSYPKGKEQAKMEELPPFLHNIDFDAQHILLAKITETKPSRCWVYQLRQGESFGQKLNAILQMQAQAPSKDAEAALWAQMRHPNWYVRSLSLEALEHFIPKYEPGPYLDSLALLLKTDPRSDVRNTALQMLASMAEQGLKKEDPRYNRILDLLEAATQDSAYSVMSGALVQLGYLDNGRALKHARRMKGINHEMISQAVCNVLLEAEDPAANGVVIEKLWKLPGYGRMFIMNSYSAYMDVRSKQELQDIVPVLQYTARQDGLWFIRFTAFKLLWDMQTQLPELKPWLAEYRENERDPKIVEQLKKL